MTAEPAPAGVEIGELDPAVRPQDDLYRHVNGRWMDRTEIPADKARWGTFYILAEEAEKAAHEELEEARQSAAPDTEERKLGDLYASFMDTERIEALRWTPLADELAEVAQVTSIDAFAALIGRLERAGTPGFFGAYVDNDPGDPERYVVFLSQAGLGLPDEAYYRDDQFTSIREAYLAHLERMLALAGQSYPGDRAARIFDLERALAAEHWDRVRSRDAQATYNLMTWREVESLAGVAPLREWLEAIKAPHGAFDEVVVGQPSFVEGLGRLLVHERLEAWKDWLAWQLIRSAAPYLHDEAVKANFDFYGRTLTGATEMRERWKRGVGFAEAAMGFAIGRIYVEKYFPENAKAEMDVLVGNLVAAYRQSIATLEWMTPTTRERAREKLEKFTPKVGYPANWRDYSALQVHAGDLFGNAQRAAEFETDREFAKIGRPLDRDEWFMTPQTVNAYYNPGFNEIVFPAAILQYPFFDSERDDAANYGAIGAVIGHEIGHGFDDQGSRFDGDGRLVDWWTDADRAAFDERAAKLIAQYDGLQPNQVPGQHVNGALTVGENIGDLGGLGIAWKAYLISLAGAQPPVIDGLTAEQRFFFSWAQTWRTTYRDEEAARLLAIDPHSPPEFRCNQIARNLDVFANAFGLTEDDGMWLEPEDRVTIW